MQGKRFTSKMKIPITHMIILRCFISKLVILANKYMCNNRGIWNSQYDTHTNICSEYLMSDSNIRTNFNLTNLTTIFFLYIYIKVMFYFMESATQKTKRKKEPDTCARYAIMFVTKSALSLMAIWCLRLPSFESCIQQAKTTCFLSMRTSLAFARASK